MINDSMVLYMCVVYTHMHISKLEVKKRNEKEQETQSKSYSNPLFIEGNKIGTAVRGTPKHEKVVKELFHKP